MRKLLLSFCLLALAVLVNAQTATPPSLGDGTVGNPYQIATLNNLYWISQNPGKWYSHYIQTANINASSTSTWNSGEGWQPIGYGDGGPNQFRGTYNGQNHTISGLYINKPGTNILGLFGSTYMANISNLGLVNVNITGNNRVGSLVGQHDASSVITSCYSTGNINANSEVGGLVGYVFQQAEIHKSYSSASVTANSTSGGLVGSMSSGAIVNECYATGSVNNLNNGSVAGGLVGSALVFSNIKKSYAQCSVDAGEPIGGLVGRLSTSFVTYSYSTGALTSGSSNIGGLVGGVQGSPEVTNSFWDITTSNAGTSSGGVGKPTADMKTYSTFYNAGWDYIDESANGTNDVWGMNPTDNNGYPFLAWQGYTNQVTPVINSLSAQDVTGDSFNGRGIIVSLGSGITQHGITWNTTGMPNNITDAKTEEGSTTQTGEFSSLATGLDPKTIYYFRAYATNAYGTSYGQEYSLQTILAGDGSEGNPYLIATWEDVEWIVSQPYNSPVLAGHFLQVADIDAGGASMYPIGKRSTGASTPFSGVYNGNGHTISNVVISNPGQSNMGFFNSINGGEVKRLGLINFSVTGSDYVGAFSGSANNAIITECYAKGVSITANGWGGGLIGIIGSNTIVSKCYATGNITGTGSSMHPGNIGGLVGRMAVAEVNNSYTHVHVAGSSNYSGGFTGVIDGGTIINSYSTGTVTMTGLFTSGFVAWDFENTVIGSFWDIDSSNRLNSRVGDGLTTAQMTQYLTFSEAGWDMVQETENGTDDIWGINPAENDGYPFLMWQGITPDVTYPSAVTTLAASEIANEEAMLNGSLIRVGIPSPAQHGFVWNTTGDPNMNDDNVISLGAISETGTFSFELTGIGAISTYYFRAFVTTDLGTFTGNVQTFKTVLEGSGTELDPYVIVSLSDLQWLMNNPVHWDKYFEQASDIDASLTSQWSSETGFTPIGNSGTKFTGQYNGNGHSITGLYINRPTTDYQGLFGYLENALISNLNVLDVDVYADERVGIIAGHADGSTITNCNTSGTVNGFMRVGGIAGNIGLISTVSDCNSTALINSRGTSLSFGGGIVGSSTGTSTIQGSTFNGEYAGLNGDYHGGIVGFINGGSILDSESDATIIASGDRVGGIAGYVTNMVEIRNCIALGTTQGVDNVGGLAGYMTTNIPLLINSQSSGNVIGSNNVGGLVGSLRSTGKIEDSWSDAHVTGTSRVGGAVGEAKDANALITNSYSTGNVEGTTAIGGFVGAVETSAEVRTSYSTATVSASTTHAGGFVGRVESLGKVFNSYALGTVTGASTIGGFAGSINNTGTEVSHCFSAGRTNGTTTTNVRGFAGQSYQATILNNLFDNETSGLISGGGGAIGKTNTEMRTLSTYLDQGWDFIGESVNGTDDFWGINGSDNLGYPFHAWQGYEHSIPAIISTLAPENILGTSADLHGDILELNGHTLIQHGFTWNTTGNPNKDDDPFHNLGSPGGLGNFNYELSGLTPGATYYVRTFAVNSFGKEFYGNTREFLSGPAGEGTEAQPFLISDMDDYIWLINNSNHWDKHFLQINDIDASVTSSWDNANGSTPIGNSITSFTGVYDGNNFTISGLYIRRTSTSYLGMFGYISNAVLKNIMLDDLYIRGTGNLGGLVAEGTGSNEINNCTIKGTVWGSSSYIGGLAGQIAGVVNSSHFDGDIIARNYAGGLIGRIQTCTVSNSSVVANISVSLGSAYTGGLAGVSSASAIVRESWANSIITHTNAAQGNSHMGGLIGSNYGIIDNCYVMGSITTLFSPAHIGGLIGYNVNNTLVSNSYANVQITGTSATVGGAIGYSNVDVGNVFWDVTTSGVATSAGGSQLVGKTTAEMNNISTYLNATFDFLGESENGTDYIWGFNPEQNSSYPFLAWQSEFEHKFSPAITIATIDDVTSVSANINASIEHLGNPSAIAHGFCWNTTGNPTLSDNVISLGEPSETGSFGYFMANLKPNEQYYVRAFITNEDATYYGNEQSFNTPVKEIVFTGSFTAISKEYDGTTVAETDIENLVADGVVVSAAGVSISVLNFDFESPDVGNNLTVGLSEAVLDGVDKDRYVVNLDGSPTAIANINKKQLTVTGAEAQGKVYDGNTNATITGATLVGKVDGEDVAIGAQVGQFNNKNVGTAKSVMPILTIVGADVSNYTLVQPTGLTATITSMQLTVVGANVTDRVYNKTSLATISGATLSGIVDGDAIALSNHTSGVFAQATVGTIIPVNVSMTLSGEDQGNYDLVQPNLTGNITHRPLSITPISFNKTVGIEYTFQGNEFTADNLVAGDDVTGVELLSAGADLGATVGAYNIVITSDSETGTGLTNYSITYNTGTLTVVDQTELFLEGISVSNKTYDGNNVATVNSWGTLTGVDPMDEVEIDISAAVVTYSNKNVGDGKTVTISGLSLAGSDASKYYINNHSSTANILVRNLYLSNFVASDKIYDATVNASGTGFSDDRVVGDDLSFSFIAQFADKHAGANKSVNFTNITVSGGADVGNYGLTNDEGVAYANIFVKELTVGGSFTVFDKEFDGTDAATIDQNSLVVSEVIINDDVTFVPIAVFTGANTGEDIEVILSSGSSLLGDDIDNYLLNLSGAPTTSASILEPAVTLYTLSIEIIGDGVVEVDGVAYTNIIYLQSGLTVNLEAIPGMDDQFDGWSGDESSLNSTISIIMDDNKSITATFSEEVAAEYTVAFTVTDGTDPIVGASISINSQTLTTDAQGEVSISLTDGSYPYTVILNDYETAEGTITVSGTDVVEAVGLITLSSFHQVLSQLVVYPSPFRHMLIIDNANGVSQIIITNLIGQRIKEISNSGENRVTILTGDLKPGVYLIILQTTEGESVTRKIVRN